MITTAMHGSDLDTAAEGMRDDWRRDGWLRQCSSPESAKLLQSKQSRPLINLTLPFAADLPARARAVIDYSNEACSGG
jgi:hypothetical protein